MSRQSEASRTDAEMTTQGGGGRMAGGERRDQIVRVAMQLFSERGFRGVTTKEIAQAAGVSEAIIFRHFATKDELYTAIIDFKSCSGMGAGLGPHRHEGATEHPVVETIRCAVGEAMGRGDDRAVFGGIALAMMEHHQRDPQFLRLLLFSALEGHQLSQMFWDRNVRVMYELLGGYIRERQRAGALREVDPFVVVRAFLGSVIHHSLNNTLWDRDPARRILNVANEDAAREFTEILLRGVMAQRAGAASPRRGGGPKRAASKVKGKKKN